MQGAFYVVTFVPLLPGVGPGEGALHQVDLLFACHGIKLQACRVLPAVQHGGGWKSAFHFAAPQANLYFFAYVKNRALRQLQSHARHRKINAQGLCYAAVVVIQRGWQLRGDAVHTAHLSSLRGHTQCGT